MCIFQGSSLTIQLRFASKGNLKQNPEIVASFCTLLHLSSVLACLGLIIIIVLTGTLLSLRLKRFTYQDFLFSPRKWSPLAIISMNLLLLFQSRTSFFLISIIPGGKISSFFLKELENTEEVMTESPAGLWDMFRTVLWGPWWPNHGKTCNWGSVCRPSQCPTNMAESGWSSGFLTGSKKSLYCQPICAQRWKKSCYLVDK